MSGQRRRRDPILVQSAKPLRHPHDRSVLRPQLFEMPLRALDDEDRLRQVRRVDHRELSACRRGHENEDERPHEYSSHHWGLLLRLAIEAPSRA
jgi:hypothetical protein